MKKDARNLYLMPNRNPEYKRDEFFVPASDEKGHSAKLFCRIHPGLSGEIENFVAMKLFPYENSSQLIRHAIVNHLKSLADLARQNGEGVGHMNWIEAAMAVTASARRLDEFQKFFSESRSLINKLVEQGDRGEARKLLKELMEKIGQAHKSERVYKAKYLAEAEKINKDFGDLLGDSVSIKPSEAKKLGDE